eukprot:5263800-Amphidinium_carterae.1
MDFFLFFLSGSSVATLSWSSTACSSSRTTTGSSCTNMCPTAATSLMLCLMPMPGFHQGGALASVKAARAGKSLLSNALYRTQLLPLHVHGRATNANNWSWPRQAQTMSFLFTSYCKVHLPLGWVCKSKDCKAFQ